MIPGKILRSVSQPDWFFQVSAEFSYVFSSFLEPSASWSFLELPRVLFGFLSSLALSRDFFGSLDPPRSLKMQYEGNDFRQQPRLLAAFAWPLLSRVLCQAPGPLATPFGRQVVSWQGPLAGDRAIWQSILAPGLSPTPCGKCLVCWQHLLTGARPPRSVCYLFSNRTNRRVLSSISFLFLNLVRGFVLIYT